MTTRRQTEANQRNGQHGTGPSTNEDEQQARRDALKPDLSGAGIVLSAEEQEAIERRKAEWKASFSIANPHEERLFDQLVTATVQIDRCHQEERTLRASLAERASTCWDEDRRLAAKRLAAGLSRKPSLVSLQLRQTAQGADWLLERWESLGRALEQKGKWTEKQRRLALDLLGTPPEFRDGPTKLDPIVSDDDPKSYRAALVAKEIARLKHARETFLADRDAREQAVAEMGLSGEIPRALAQLRRFEAACERRMRSALSQLQRGGPAGKKTAAASLEARSVEAGGLPPISDEEFAEMRRRSERMRQETAETAPAPAPAAKPTTAPVPVSGEGEIGAFTRMLLSITPPQRPPHRS